MSVKRYLILLLLVSFCGGGSETTAVEDSATTTSSSTTSSTTTTSSSTTSSTTTTSSSTTSSTTTLPPTTGVGLDDNGNEIYPAVQSIKITKPNVTNGELFSIKRFSQSELDNRPIDELRGNEIEIILNVVPGTNPIYAITIVFGQITEKSYISNGQCAHRVGNDRKNDIKPIYSPQEVVLFCGDFNNNSFTSNYQHFDYTPGDVSIVQIYIEDDFGNMTSYFSPLTQFKGTGIKEGFKTSLGETDTVFDEPTEAYIQFFPTNIIFKIEN